MKRLMRCVYVILFSAILVAGGATQAQSVNLRYVFRDSLWGSGIGGVAGISFWALADEGSDEFSSYLLTGMAIGALGGIAYGLLSVPIYRPPGPPGPPFLHNGQPKGLFHFDVEADMVDIRPMHLIPRYDYRREDETGLVRFDLFTTSF